MALNTYIAEFSGHFLGGTAVVRAESRDEALDFVVREMQATGLGHRLDKEIKLTQVRPSSRGVIHFENGDY